MEIPTSGAEQEQSREQIEALLKEALEKNLVVNLVVEDRIANQPNMIIDGLDKEAAYFSYLYEEGGVGEGYYVPMQINRIKRVTLKGPVPPGGND